MDDPTLEQVVKNVECAQCQTSFPITDQDQEFYTSMKVPEPTFCPDCRQQRRLSWRNERTLYSRKCSLTGKTILSTFSEDKNVQAYNTDDWYTDKWNPLDTGRDFDFTRPFFDQFSELMSVTPMLSRSILNNHNCDYVNECGWSKNCYLIFEADQNHECIYCSNIFDCKTCIDSIYCTKSELCYECIDCINCYNLRYSQNCTNTSDSWFMKNSIGCQNCFGSVNLRNKQYYFLNKKYTKEEYEAKLAALDLQTVAGLEKLHRDFYQFSIKYPHKGTMGIRNEISSGDYLYNTKNCKNCYDLNTGHDCKFVYNSRNFKKVYDVMTFGNAKGVEFSYEGHLLGDAVRDIYFSEQIWTGCYSIYYSKFCMQSSHDLFGCVSMQHKNFCILNKQYSEPDYKALFPKIVEYMKSTGEYGEYFPTTHSIYAYNETVAQIYYPMTKEQVLAKGWKWKDKDMKEYITATCEVPRKIEDVEDSITKETLACTECSKNYRIISQELVLYRRLKLPVPLKCHDCRYLAKMRFRNPRTLHKRPCDKCAVEIETTYAPNRPEPVYCEQCYINSTD